MDRRWHTAECKARNGCTDIRSPVPCNTKLKLPLTFDIGKERIQLYTCPANIIDNEDGAWLQMYGMYKNGITYTEGGLRNQPNLWVEVMTALDGIVADIEQKKMEEAQKSRPPGRKR